MFVSFKLLFRRFFLFFLVFFFFLNTLYFFVLDPSIVIYNLVLVFFLLLAVLLSVPDLEFVRSKFFYSSIFYFVYHRSLSFKRILFFFFLDHLYDYIINAFNNSFDSFKLFLTHSLYLYVYRYINFLIKNRHSIRNIVLKSCYLKTVNLFFRSFF